MSFFKRIPGWSVITVLLLAFALFFKFALRGYSYIAYTLTFFAALIVAHRFFGKVLWRITFILVCIGLIYFIIVEIPIIKNARTDSNPQRDYLVVLGAAVHGDHPSPALVHRLDGAYEYLEKYPDSVAIVSGGKGKGENKSEAQAMFEYLTGRGISTERIIMEDRATSTKENLLYSYEIITDRGDSPQDSVAILSSPYHLFRAKCMSNSIGVEAAGVAGHFDNPILTLNYFIREAFGITHFWVFGW